MSRKKSSAPVMTAEEEAQAFSTAMATFRERVAQGVTTLHESPRKLYVPDRKFVVIREGARFEGIVQHGEKFWSGWSRPLTAGEVITCDGWRKGMDTDQEGVNWTAKRVPENALWVQVWPIHGLFTPWPMEGFLKALPDDFE